ncbi:hypothetical protein H0I76_12430 [Limibaculum sp. M0105]|uniref:asparagine synthase (glutamine-hydrolyzing) n=1 Tax=Thermohalobaculum xanthum TaxID=2753746 RepID=A0A8J7M8U5_9RHOB|nr:asparagine synthase-related protein [Thermohalobaculum xanthum]MBK0399997.1 hypothetical protein [Thermohalobaculum xanthum]
MVDLIFGVLSASEEHAALVFDRLRHSLTTRGSGYSIAHDGKCRLGVVRRHASGIGPAPRIARGKGGALIAGDLRLTGAGDHAASPGLGTDEADLALATALDNPDRFPDRLAGDFAIAAWFPARGELVLARDRIGIRPLFLARMHSGGIAFASLPRALVEAGCAEADTDPRELIRWLCGPAPAVQQTHLRAIRRVPAGHVLRVSDGRERCVRYWRLARQPTIRPASPDALQSELRILIERAVARCLPDEGPVATLLSGGLDSAAIGATAARRLAGSGRAITGFCRATAQTRAHLGAPDQTGLATSVAREAGIPLRLVPTDYIAAVFDAPPVPGVCFAGDLDGGDSEILAQAAALGADRLLCGLGGDEGASGHGSGRYADALGRGLIGACLAAVARDARREGSRAIRRLVVEVMRAVVPRRLLSATLGSIGRAGYVPPGAEFVAPGGRGFVPARLLRSDGPRPFLESNHYQAGLEARAIKAAEHGLRYVYPLLDPELLDFTTRAPALFWCRDGIARWPMRAAMAGLLPDEVRLAPDKLLDDGTEALWLAENRTCLAGLARRLGRLPEVAEILDMEKIARDIEAVPPPAEVTQRIRDRAAQGRQFDDLFCTGWIALFGARFIASGGGMRPVPPGTRQADA